MGSIVVNPLVSVVTLAYNRRNLLADLLHALREQTYSPFEVIVVDNASEDGTAEMVRAEFPDVNLLRMPQNFGMVAYNIGMVNAKGEYILVVDDDGLPGEDWISEVVKRFQENDKLGVVACAICIHETGEIAGDSAQYVCDDGSDREGYPCAAYNGTGAGIRASVLREVGYYPFSYFRSWLEFHLSTRVLDSGWEVRCFPEIVVRHQKPPGGITRTVAYHGLRNYYWYVWTFYPGAHAIVETVRYVGSRVKWMLQGRLPLGLFARATADAVAGLPGVLRQRAPIKPETLDRLRYIRAHGRQ